MKESHTGSKLSEYNRIMKENEDRKLLIKLLKRAEAGKTWVCVDECFLDFVYTADRVCRCTK